AKGVTYVSIGVYILKYWTKISNDLQTDVVMWGLGLIKHLPFILGVDTSDYINLEN
ncbi:hypothetical protein ACJX0J_036154, partial [Zea mays]